MASWWEANLQMLDAMGVWEYEIQPKFEGPGVSCCHRYGDQEKWTWCDSCPKANRDIALRVVMVITEDVQGLLKMEAPDA